MGPGKGRGKKIAYTFRICRTHRELAAFVRLQKRVFELADRELYPVRSLVIMNKIGGAVLGAFDPKGRMVGFLDWLPAWEGEERYFYSLALGVLPGFRDQGLGRAIKQEQRRLALKAGIERIQWTFDPLRVKNAFFNLEKLGAVAHRYIPNHHGELCLNSQAGLATDRLEAVWYLRSRRVKQALARRSSRRAGSAGKAQVTLPLDVWRMAEKEKRRARAVQQRVRREFMCHLSRGLVVTGIRLGTDGATYLLDRYSP